ncbi:MAG: hypothetical protein UW68_C0025G0004 [Candidatus Collierbacteria bacterium GW2011_GWB1_44_6]|uniref:Uncharacterized protein n=2 Tax=Candidatus Collieribacteriota TaxID=1752725 RepID=A0A0G1ML96_9BACT|nr:MAG: hypothetical protein UV68_C0051G0003 [Candidatus Collierbacteria bacterium GW2011_GWC2_43_12]KKT72789.1 MAG: hypothetical protein UW68_C0025G0004 [Candidatus Collierbacteria bacterium GW2011_GWB1_44_6]
MIHNEIDALIDAIMTYVDTSTIRNAVFIICEGTEKEKCPYLFIFG